LNDDLFLNALEKNPDYNPDNYHTDLAKAAAKMIGVDLPPELVKDFHGDIVFYGDKEIYKARFTNGKLTWIKEISDEI
jgi:hypothetical protein